MLLFVLQMHQAASNEYRLQVRERPNNIQHSEVLPPKASTKEFELTQQRTSSREEPREGAIATDSLNDCQLFYGSAPPLRSLDSIADSVSFAGRLIRSAAGRAGGRGNLGRSRSPPPPPRRYMFSRRVVTTILL